MVAKLVAPFPYAGGKRRWAAEVWEYLGDDHRASYAEPFFGSGAMLLAAPVVHKKEIVCDTNGFIANFWRALRADPDAVAYYADWPKVHQDLHARHIWLMKWGAEHAELIHNDCDFYDAKAAGYWAWGQSCWIGAGWCIGEAGDSIPKTADHGAVKGRVSDSRPSNLGRGATADRLVYEVEPFVTKRGEKRVRDGIPYLGRCAQGVNIDRPVGDVQDTRPMVGARTGVDVERPVQQNGNYVSGPGMPALANPIVPDGAFDGTRLQPWFRALAFRLARVTVLNRSWESALTPAVLWYYPDGRGKFAFTPKVFLDPPYRVDTGRSGNLYQSDVDGRSTDIACQVYDWAVAHGEQLAIAYAMHEGDFPTPAGWEISAPRTFMAKTRKDSGARDIMMYSPVAVANKRGSETSQMAMF